MIDGTFKSWWFYRTRRFRFRYSKLPWK